MNIQDYGYNESIKLESGEIPARVISTYRDRFGIVCDQTTLNMIQDISSIIARKPMIIGEI